MTDWDRRGGSLARSLRENLSALDVRYDDRIRGELAVLCRPYAKDVESVDAVVLLLQRSCGLSRRRTEGVTFLHSVSRTPQATAMLISAMRIDMG